MNTFTPILKTVSLGIVTGLLLATARPALAQDNVQELKQQLAQLKAKVAALEARQKTPDIPARYSGAAGWDPLEEMTRMHNAMEEMFDASFSQGFSPPQGMFSNQLFFDNSQLKEVDGGYLITVNIAGFDQNKLEINVNDHAVSISGEYKNTAAQHGKNAAFESHSYGRFLNTIPLPPDADVTKMKTDKKDDRLEIFLPRKET